MARSGGPAASGWRRTSCALIEQEDRHRRTSTTNSRQKRTPRCPHQAKQIGGRSAPPDALTEHSRWPPSPSTANSQQERTADARTEQEGWQADVALGGVLQDREQVSRVLLCICPVQRDPIFKAAEAVAPQVIRNHRNACTREYALTTTGLHKKRATVDP